jgi:hypothetical protein
LGRHSRYREETEGKFLVLQREGRGKYTVGGKGEENSGKEILEEIKRLTERKYERK